jgi:ribonucleoside-triphosphate reductase
VPSCTVCSSENVYGVTRIVGYFSRVNNWNKSKIGELNDRHKGDYSVGRSSPTAL